MTRTALIVEDEPDMANILAELIRPKTFNPIVTHDGTTGLQAARTEHPDVILLDLMLPDIDGFRVCESLKLERETNLIPVVMVTALGDRKDFVRGIRVGANEYVAKPFQADELLAAVDRAVAWRQERLDEGQEGEVRLDVLSEETSLKEANSLLASLFVHTPLSDEQILHLTQAVMEMGRNAMEWGHRFQRDLAIHITYRIDAEKVTIAIRDEGPGFDPSRVPHAAQEDDPVTHLLLRDALGLREGGYGMMITRGLVDEMNYNEAGNEVTLVKHFNHERRATDGNGGVA